jgi:hypothetical protein
MFVGIYLRNTVRLLGLLAVVVGVGRPPPGHRHGG